PSTNGSEDISEPLTAPEEIPATPGEPIIESPVVTPVPVQTPPVATQPITAATPASSGARIMATPIAKNVAAANGVDLSQVPSSGPNGRIVKADVENFVKNGAGAVKATPKPVDLPISYGSMAPVTETVDVALNPTMKIVAARLLESHLGAPFFFVTLKIETDALIAFRAQLNNTPGYKISVNDLIIKAVASNLRAFPRVNAAFHGDKIRQHGNIDISIAVALEDGLITPIVKNADQKALGQISSEVKQLAQKAQSGTLLPEEYQGGTFTISNMGMYGVSEFTAILNPPQAGILAVGGTQTELYKTGSGDIEERNYMNVTLTSDHRVINGALAAQFLQGLKVILENPVSMVI
ncbi:MAG: 2-oxo acid dehydrogenase subunit E2, partial [Bacteroidetes bacterium]|nr:2-oxo acid dehydrogenase subunit E2 [Bacteroidota bacterium]